MKKLILTIRLMSAALLFGVAVPWLISSGSTLGVLAGFGIATYAIVSFGYNIKKLIEGEYHEDK